MGPGLAELAERLGTPLMPWQRQVADVGLELLADGRPAYREVCFTVPRQSGKTSLLLAWEVHRAIAWAQTLGPQRIAYSAQSGRDASQKFIEDQVAILEPRARMLGISNLRRANGSEGAVWHNGSRIGLLASLAESGHGKTVDLGVKDELFADTDMRRDQALVPAMSTRRHGQMLTASTMGTLDSIALNAKVDQGRAAVLEGRRADFAYFEWSAADDDDPGDEATWWGCMPALGRTVGVEAIRHAYATMELEEFRRAFLNIATMADDRVIPKTAWNLVNSPDVTVTAPEVFALDATHERGAAAIVGAGNGAVSVVEHRPGMAWCVARCVELSRKYDVPIAIDLAGPAGSLQVELLAADVPLIELKPAEVVRAAGMFYDAVLADRIRIRRDPALDAAVAGAAKRTAGDAWTWGRRNSRTDIAPLVAATIAYAASQMHEESVYEHRNLIVL